MTNAEGNKNLENKKPQQKNINFINCVRDDIILDKRVIQRFFAYSISELYNKHFSKIDFNNNDLFYKITNKDNIYLQRKTTSENRKSKNKKKRNKCEEK